MTTVTNNGTFTVRRRTFNYKGFKVACAIQYANGYSKTSYTVWHTNNEKIGYGNHTKKMLKNRVNYWINA